MKISSIIIAKNEEKNISRCINSLLNCVDEIILLVDNSTTDKTLEIARSFSMVKAEPVKWMGFSKTKQYAVSLSSNEWILWIDADEELTKELSDEINIWKKNNPRFNAYSFPRVANFLGRWIKHSGWYPGRVVRLFDKTKVYFSDSDVHEHLIINGHAGELNNNIKHYTDPSIHHYFEKFNSYTSLAADELAKKGKDFALADILLRPVIIFIKMYIIKMGFLDGLQGFILAVFSSTYVFTKYCKLWEIKTLGVKKDGTKLH
ncbi:MAG: glycosyltransferase family 2 protein [Ignavibacteriaceae bacterium]